MATQEIEYVRNEKGEATAVIVPIELWRDIEAEQETAYLLASPAKRQRLIEAMNRDGGISLEDALARLGV